MNNHRVIGIELVVDDKGTARLIKFTESAKQAFGQAERSAEGLGASMAKGARRAQETEGAMAEVERRAGSLTSKVKLMGGSFEGLYRTGKRAFDRLHQAGRGAFNRLHRAGSIFWQTTRRITGAVFSLRGALVGLGLGLVAKSFLDVSRETENYHTRLTTLLGSQQKATEAMRYFQEVASGVPFTLRQVVESGTSLEAFGANSKQWLSPLTDLAAVMGIELPEAAQALGRAYAGGAGAADIFRERGILQIIKDAAKLKAGIDDITKLTLPQFRKLMLLTFTDPDGKIAGASQGLAKNWDGMISMLSDKWFQFRQKMMSAGVFDLLKNQLQRLLNVLDTHQDTITRWAESAGRAVEGLLKKGVGFVDNIIKNWSVWEARWESFKKGAGEVWRQTKNVASAVSSLIKTALDGWNSLPEVVKTWGILGAVLFGGKIGKIMLAMSVVSAGMDKTGKLMKQASGVGDTGERYQELYNQKFAELTGREPGTITNFLAWASGDKAAQQAHAWALAQLAQGEQQTQAPAIPSFADLESQLMAEVQTGLSRSYASLNQLLAGEANRGAGTGGTGAGTAKWDIGSVASNKLTDAEKLIAKANEATAKQQREYIKMIAESVDLENQIRRQGLTAHEQNLDQLKEKYETTQDRIDDLVLGGVITEKKATDLKSKLNVLYLDEVQKAQAKHDQSLLRSTQLYGLKGRELKLAQLQFELQDLEEAGHSAVLIEQYKAQKLEEINKGWLERTLDSWGDMETVIPEATRNMLQGVQGALSNYLASSLADFEAFTDAIENIWKQMLAQLIAQWTVSGFAGLLKDLINLLKGGSGWENTLKGFGLDGILGGGSEKGGVGDTVASAGASVAGSQIVRPAIASGLSYLGLDTAADIVAGKTSLWSAIFSETATETISEAAVQAATEAGAKVAAEYGVTAAGEFAGSQAASGAAQYAASTWGAGGEFGGAIGANTVTSAQAADAAMFGQTGMEGAVGAGGSVLAGIGSIAAVYEAGLMAAEMLGTQGSVPHLWEIPGTIWEGFSGGEGMTPEKAMANWFGGGGSDGQGQGWMAFIENMTAKMQELGQTFDSPGLTGSGFEQFGASAREAAQDLQLLVDTGAMTQDQVDAMVASMDPLSQEFIASGQAANTLGGEVQQLVEQMNAATNSMAMTSSESRNFNERIDDLAGRLGLTGEAAEEFRSKIWELSNSFTYGGEEAAAFGDSLDRFVADTLGGITEGAGASAEAIRNLINSMKGVGSAGQQLSGGTRMATFVDYGSGVNELGLSTGPAASNAEFGYYHQGGLVRHSGGDIAPWGWVSYEQLLRLAGDEVLAKLQMGEYVVRAGSVNHLTQPWLETVNDTGRPPVMTVPEPVMIQTPASPPAPAAKPEGTSQPVIIHLKVVTPDGRVLRQEVYQDMEHGGGPQPRKLEVRV